MIVLEVALPVPINKLFYYLPPEDIVPEDIVGKRVKVQFGKRILTAYVILCRDIEKDITLNLKKIIEVIDLEILINRETINLACYISENYLCSLGKALASIIPVSICAPKKITKNKKLNNEIIYKYENRNLNQQQKNAVDLINASLTKNIYTSFLLFGSNCGVTASGKTEVYVNTIEYALKKNRSAIVLIPTISLIPQFLYVMAKNFGPNIVGVWHSGISNVQKYKLFFKAKNNDIKIMIGTRSAVFSPFKNLGVIIIDEEHEYTYGQKQKPSYDVREIAKWRAMYHNAIVLLGSATPSLESYKDAIENKIDLIELNEYVNKKELPNVKVVSLETRVFRTTLLLTETIEAISEALLKKERIIVFLNHRGYSRIIVCQKCGSIYQCSKCSISMVLHRNPDRLRCHYCGEIKYFPILCPICKSKDIIFLGNGTQKVEYELKKIFKNARIFRLDGDTIYSKRNYEKIYNIIKNEEYNILLGTQMITKGFNFPKVGLVCIIDADTSLYLPDFKSTEKTFQLITQLLGHSGGNGIQGNVIVQTNHPQHYVIKCAKNHDFVTFYNIEIEQRKKMFYPPFCSIAKISIKNKYKKETNESSEQVFAFLRELIKFYELKLDILGPIPAYIEKLNNIYRKYIIIKGDKKNIIKLAGFLDNFKQLSGTFIDIELMPSDLIQ
jgi:primosomal protein N' (replication factor Y)